MLKMMTTVYEIMASLKGEAVTLLLVSGQGERKENR